MVIPEVQPALRRSPRKPRMQSSEKISLLPQSRPNEGKYVLVVHGGAGTMSRSGSTPEQRAAYHAGLEDALKAGYGILSQGGEAMDAAVAAVSAMEGVCSDPAIVPPFLNMRYG